MERNLFPYRLHHGTLISFTHCLRVPITVIKTSLFLVIAVFCIAFPRDEVFAQKEKDNVDILLHPDKFYKRFFPRLKIKRNPPDSLFIKTYPNYLSVGMHVLSPAIRLDIDSRRPKPDGFDPSSKFRTNISDVLGFSASYRFVSVGFAFPLRSGMNTHNDYSPSRYRTATIKYNSAAYSLQFKYLRIQGFTDVNQPNRLDPNPMYTQRPDMFSKEFQFEGLYNFSWKKYSYIAPLTFSQRQIKSRAGFLLKAGVYYNRLSSDSPLIDQRQQQYYDDFNDVKAIQSVSIKIAPGLGGNLVFFKRVYLSIAAFTSFDLYYYKYLKLPDEKVHGKQAFVFVLDGKASLGYQSRRLYAGLRYEAERRAGVFHSMKINTIYSYTGVELGYRFDAPHLVKKVYKKTMPPGM